MRVAPMICAKKKKKDKRKSFFWIEGQKLNEQTGKMEPVKYKVWWE